MSLRGASGQDARAAVVRDEGDWLEVDTSHASYARKYTAITSNSAPPAKAPADAGPGTELKGLLKLIGITSSPNCSCNARAKQMDEWGADECERRMPEILAWLEQEATRRGLPFVRFAAEQAVKLAIRRARKNAVR
jgi:hypothetical protein